MHPKFLEHEFNQSKANLGVETIDLMQLQNSYEKQSSIMTTE